MATKKTKKRSAMPRGMYFAPREVRCHVSSAEMVEWLREARARKIKIGYVSGGEEYAVEFVPGRFSAYLHIAKRVFEELHRLARNRVATVHRLYVTKLLHSNETVTMPVLVEVGPLELAEEAEAMDEEIREGSLPDGPP